MKTHQETMDIFRSAHQRGKGTQLFGKSQQHFIFIINGVSEEGDQLTACSLNSQCQCDGGQFLDRVQSQLYKKKFSIFNSVAVIWAYSLKTFVLCNSAVKEL